MNPWVHWTERVVYAAARLIGETWGLFFGFRIPPPEPPPAATTHIPGTYRQITAEMLDNIERGIDMFWGIEPIGTFGEIDATLDDLNREYFTLLDQEAH